MEMDQIHMGTIKWIDAANQTGVISDQGKGDLVNFDFDDVEMGTAREGKLVQFTREEPNGRPSVARNIVVLNDIAKGKFK